MGFFGKKPDKGKKEDGKEGNIIQEPIQKQLGILRYLCTSGKFDRSKMETYISMAERIGMRWDTREKDEMLNATLYFAPKMQGNGAVLDGFNQLRIEFVEAHVQAVSQGIQIIKTLPPNPATVAFLQDVTKEMRELIKTLNIG